MTTHRTPLRTFSALLARRRWEALTKEQHDELVALRDRPLTQDPIQRRSNGARPDKDGR